MNDDHQAEDQQLQDAYARLGTALLPPPDVAVRVEREVGARRRHRRAAIAVAAVLVVAGVAGGAVALGSGDDQHGDTVAVDEPAEPQGSFVLTRPDGSTQEFDDLTLSCDTAPMGSPGEAGHIYVFSPLHFDETGEALTEPYVMFDGVVDKIGGKTFTLPVDGSTGRSDDRPFVLFVAEGGAGDSQRANEVSSAEPGAAGTVRVLRASCDPTPVLELEVDTTLGSELELGTLDLAGSFG